MSYLALLFFNVNKLSALCWFETLLDAFLHVKIEKNSSYPTQLLANTANFHFFTHLFQCQTSILQDQSAHPLSKSLCLFFIESQCCLTQTIMILKILN